MKRTLQKSTRLKENRRVRRILELFKLDFRDILEIPYDRNDLGLKLPESVPARQFRIIFAATLAYRLGMHQGDLFNWAENNPGCPWDEAKIKSYFFQIHTGESSYHNRKSVAKLVPIEERRPGLTFNMYSAIAKAGLPLSYREPLYDLCETRHPRPAPTELATLAQMQRARFLKADPPLKTFPKQIHTIGRKAAFEQLDRNLFQVQSAVPEQREHIAAWRKQLRQWESQLARLPKRRRGLSATTFIAMFLPFSTFVL